MGPDTTKVWYSPPSPEISTPLTFEMSLTKSWSILRPNHCGPNKSFLVATTTASNPASINSSMRFSLFFSPHRGKTASIPDSLCSSRSMSPKMPGSIPLSFKPDRAFLNSASYISQELFGCTIWIPIASACNLSIPVLMPWDLDISPSSATMFKR